MQEILFKIRYFERRLSKTLQKLTLFLLPDPVPFNGQNYQKQKGPGTRDQLLFRLQIKFTKISFLVMYYLTKFELFKKLHLQIYASQSWHHKLFHFHCSCRIWKVWKGRGKITKTWISWERKCLFRWNTKQFP